MVLLYFALLKSKKRPLFLVGPNRAVVQQARPRRSSPVEYSLPSLSCVLKMHIKFNWISIPAPDKVGSARIKLEFGLYRVSRCLNALTGRENDVANTPGFGGNDFHSSIYHGLGHLRGLLSSFHLAFVRCWRVYVGNRLPLLFGACLHDLLELVRLLLLVLILRRSFSNPLPVIPLDQHGTNHQQRNQPNEHIKPGPCCLRNRNEQNTERRTRQQPGRVCQI